jgi:hypothetical protein
MKTTTLVVIFVAASALFLIQPVSAQTHNGSTAGILRSEESSMDPNFEEPWDDARPSVAGPALAPAPQEPMNPQPGSMFVPQPPVGLIEPGDHPAISPYSTTLIPPDSMGRPFGGFHSSVR